MPTIGFYPNSENIGQMCIAFARIVKLESGGQQLSVTKKNHSRKVLTLKIFFFFFFFFFFLIVKHTFVFYPNHRMLNSYAFASSRIKINSSDSIRNKKKKKKKNPCKSYTARKNDIFIKKNTKIQIFLPKMRNSQQVCIWIKKYRNDKFRSNQKLSRFF